jgi:predicted ATPase
MTRIALTNVKAFRRADLRLAPLTLMTGVNAVGKSTVLQALGLLRQSSEAGMLHPAAGLLLNGDYVEIGTGADLLHDDFEPDGQGRPAVSIEVSDDGETSSWNVLVDAADREADVLVWARCDAPDQVPSLFGTSFLYLRADRIAPAVTYPRSYDTAVRRRSLGSRGQHAVNYLRVNQDAPVAPALRHSQASSSALMPQTEAWLQDLCPGVNLEATGIGGADLVRLSYGFFGRSGITSSQIRYRPTNVGFGLTYTLPVIVACLAAEQGSVILLENPEAHLHPRGQTALAALLARTAADGAQVIVETHSDHILNGIRLAVRRRVLSGDQTAVHFVDRDPGAEPGAIPAVRVSSPKISDDGMVASWPSGFFDELENALDELLEEPPKV